MRFGVDYRPIRRSVPIMAYVGANGHGKTLAMVHDTLPSLARGRPVLSTVRLYDAAGECSACSVAGCSKPCGKRVFPVHPAYTPLTSWKQLLEAERCDILLDEISGVASARSYAALPAQLAQVLVQLRKRDAVVRWTAPNWQRADVIVREVTQAVTICHGYSGVRDGDHLWTQKRLFMWVTFDAIEWEEFTLQKIDRAKPMARSFYWRRPRKLAQHTYSTLEAVETLDHISEIGTCLRCNGTRRRPTCKCPPSTEDEPVGVSLDPVNGSRNGHTPPKAEIASDPQDGGRRVQGRRGGPRAAGYRRAERTLDAAPDGLEQPQKHSGPAPDGDGAGTLAGVEVDTST